MSTDKEMFMWIMAYLLTLTFIVNLLRVIKQYQFDL